jgi:hypothetical protein
MLNSRKSEPSSLLKMTGKSQVGKLKLKVRSTQGVIGVMVKGFAEVVL